MRFHKKPFEPNSYSIERALLSLSPVLVGADGDADEQGRRAAEGRWSSGERSGRDGANGGICTNYTDNYCAALIKRRQTNSITSASKFCCSVNGGITATTIDARRRRRHCPAIAGAREGWKYAGEPFSSFRTYCTPSPSP